MRGVHLRQLAANTASRVLSVRSQRLELPRREVKAIHHALLHHVDNDLEASMAEATMQEVEELHVRIVVHGEDSVRT
jgi:hypothetical protein